MDSADDWEGAAASIHDETGLDDPPVSAFELAAMCGLKLRPGRGHGLLDGEVVRFDPTDRLVRQHKTVAHEVGHWAAKWAGLVNTEEAADYIGMALMLPRRGFDRDLRETAWDLEALRAKHVNASADLIARRIVSMRDAVCTILDEGRVTDRVYSAWLPQKLRRVSRYERALAAEALATGEMQHPEDLVWAVPVVDGSWRRVVVVCEARQLSLRL